ncbi:MAG: FecR domain-containing protein [Bacteroidota bacterium]
MTRPTPPVRRLDPTAAHRPDLTDVSPDEQAALDRTWDLLDRAPSGTSSADTDAAWNALAGRLALPCDTAVQPAPARRSIPSTRRRRARWPVALGVPAVALLAVLALVWPRPVTHVAPFGAQHTVTLPDGSTVHLNSGAQVTHTRGFDRLPFLAAPTRTVQLRGEAFFDVVDAATADGRPFVVETFNARVEVVGTQFNVRAWPTEANAQTTVTVEEGVVNVAPTSPDPEAAPSDGIRLTVGDEAMVGRGSAVVQTEAASVEQATAWRRAGLAFRGVPLTAVASELERRYATVLRLDTNVATETPLFYYQPAPGSLTAVLDDLGRARGFQYRATSDGYHLFAATD